MIYRFSFFSLFFAEVLAEEVEFLCYFEGGMGSKGEGEGGWCPGGGGGVGNFCGGGECSCYFLFPLLFCERLFTLRGFRVLYENASAVLFT